MCGMWVLTSAPYTPHLTLFTLHPTPHTPHPTRNPYLYAWQVVAIVCGMWVARLSSRASSDEMSFGCDPLDMCAPDIFKNSLIFIHICMHMVCCPHPLTLGRMWVDVPVQPCQLRRDVLRVSQPPPWRQPRGK